MKQIHKENNNGVAAAEQLTESRIASGGYKRYTSEGKFAGNERGEREADGYYIFSGSTHLTLQRLWPLMSSYSRSMKRITVARVASGNDDEKDEALKLDAPRGVL